MKMKIRNAQVIGVIVSIGLLSALSARAEKMTKLTQRSGSKMRLEGTSTAHDWRSESGLILGYLEVGPNFPLEPGAKSHPAKSKPKAKQKLKSHLSKAKTRTAPITTTRWMTRCTT